MKFLLFLKAQKPLNPDNVSTKNNASCMNFLLFTIRIYDIQYPYCIQSCSLNQFVTKSHTEDDQRQTDQLRIRHVA